MPFHKMDIDEKLRFDPEIKHYTNECQLHIISDFSSLCFAKMCLLRPADLKNSFSQNEH